MVVRRGAGVFGRFVLSRLSFRFRVMHNYEGGCGTVWVARAGYAFVYFGSALSFELFFMVLTSVSATQCPFLVRSYIASPYSFCVGVALLEEFSSGGLFTLSF